MPLRLSELGKVEKSVTLSYDGESVTVVYRPKLLTTMTRLRLLAGPSILLDTPDAAPSEWLPAVEGYFDEIARLLVTWDVLDEKGKALKPTPGLLADLPQDFINAVVRAIVEDGAPVPPNGEDSSGTSPQMD